MEGSRTLVVLDITISLFAKWKLPARQDGTACFSSLCSDKLPLLAEQHQPEQQHVRFNLTPYLVLHVSLSVGTSAHG